MKIKIFMPETLGENEMKPLVDEFGMDGDNVQYTDQTGGPDWIVLFQQPISLVVTGLTTILLVNFVKSFGTRLGENAADGISTETAKLFELFKIGIKNILKGTTDEERKRIPNFIFEPENITCVFDFAEVNQREYEEAVAALPGKLEEFVLFLQQNSIPLINDAHIGIVCVWHRTKKAWMVLSIDAIDTYGAMRMGFWD